MKVKLYRGTHEIGGTCLEILADNGKKLWVDIGLPLSAPDADVSYSVSERPDALLLSHPHQDHYGLLVNLQKSIPVFTGKVTLGLIRAVGLFLGKQEPDFRFVHFDAWKKFSVLETFMITPYLMDHSAPEAFAFLIEADGRRIFYTGDFRAEGRKKIVYDNIIRRPPLNVDIMFTEGTTINRYYRQYLGEEDMENAFEAIFRKQVNVSFVVSSGQNVDRFVSVVKACRKARKIVVADVYIALVLDIVGMKSSGIPKIGWKNIKVFIDPRHEAKLKGAEYSDLLKRCHENSVDRDVFRNPDRYVYFVRCPKAKLIEKLKPKGKIDIIYSQWEGYLKEEYKTNCSEYLNKLRIEPGVDFKVIHISGHAAIDQVIELAKMVNPGRIVAMHTDNPVKMHKEFVTNGISKLEVWEDNKEYTI